MKKIILIVIVAIVGISGFIFWQNRYVANIVVNNINGINTISFGSNSVDLSNRGLTSIPTSVFSQASLEELNVSNNHLTGAIQAEVRHLSNLRILNASNNQMTGLPAEIGQLEKLEILDVSNNNLTGLPYELGNLKNLKVLNLSGNQYSRQDLDYIRSKLSSTVTVITD